MFNNDLMIIVLRDYMLGNVFRLSARLCAKSMAVITISMLIVSYYLELVVQLVPCMICELQRHLMFIILIVDSAGF